MSDSSNTRTRSWLAIINGFLTNLTRLEKRLIMMALDASVMAISFYLALVIRYGSMDFPHRERMWPLYIALPIVGVFLYANFGIYRSMIRSMESRTIVSIGIGSIILTLCVAAVAFFDTMLLIPRTSAAIYGLLVMAGTGLWRVAARAYYSRIAGANINRERVVIYGAGAAGTELAASIQNSNRMKIVAFLDDDPQLTKSYVRGVRVYQPHALGKLKDRHGIHRVLIALPSVDRQRRREIVENLVPHQLQLQMMPALEDILDGRASLTELSEVQVQDLLGRMPVQPLPELFENAIAGKRILVTGAAGSIGFEICKQLLRLAPAQLVMLDVNEFGLHRIEQDLLQDSAVDESTQIEFILGSVTNREKMRHIFAEHNFDIVYHAAAYKHVPIIEHNPVCGVKNNALGTLIVAEESMAADVDRFVLVSTDKAVRPTNIMGATKRLAELFLQDLQARSNGTVFTCVRFGNVLGSSGSVIPVFKRQIATGGPVTVTHKEVTRYFMTITEAAELVIQAGFLAEGGDVLLLDMGEPVRVHDLATLMIRLSGKTVKDETNAAGDIEIRITGLRPGEKLYEELLIDPHARETRHPKIMRGREGHLPPDETREAVEWVVSLPETSESQAIKEKLKQLVDGYQPSVA